MICKKADLNLSVELQSWIEIILCWRWGDVML